MDISFTETAQSQIMTMCKNMQVYGISLNLKGGGCAGFEYDWGVVNTADDIASDDEVVKVGDSHFIIGATSLMFLLGTEIDYVSTAFSSNFEINNPNAQSACGCGISVNFDIDKL